MPETVVNLEKENEILHSKIVEDIRNWFRANNYTVERYEKDEINDKLLTNEFNYKFPKKYNIEPILISQNERNQFKWYTEKKSKGNVELESEFNYDLFLDEIIELLKKREYLCCSKTMSSLSKCDFLLSKNDYEIIEYISNSIEKGYLKNVDKVFIDNYGLNKLKKFWEEHKALKYKALNLLSEYFKWTYKYNNETFNEIFLEDYNLAPCNLCYK